jgi:hypothetical protein
VVEDVEEFGAESKFETFRKWKALVQSHIGRFRSGITNRSIAGVAKYPLAGLSKEPVLNQRWLPFHPSPNSL